MSFSKIYSRGKQNANPPVFFSMPFWNISFPFLLKQLFSFPSIPSFFSPLQNTSLPLSSTSLSLSLSHHTFLSWSLLLSLDFVFLFVKHCHNLFFFFLALSHSLSPILFFLLIFYLILFKSYSTRFSSQIEDIIARELTSFPDSFQGKA